MREREVRNELETASLPRSFDIQRSKELEQQLKENKI